jgi:hypothetical protein
MKPGLSSGYHRLPARNNFGSSKPCRQTAYQPMLHFTEILPSRRAHPLNCPSKNFPDASVPPAVFDLLTVAVADKS